VFSPETMQKFTRMMNKLNKAYKKKQTKKDKKKQRRQPVQPADNGGPQNIYHFHGAPSAARPTSHLEMSSGFNLPAAMRLPNGYTWQ
jgi:hypothetical protein